MSLTKNKSMKLVLFGMLLFYLIPLTFPTMIVQNASAFSVPNFEIYSIAVDKKYNEAYTSIYIYGNIPNTGSDMYVGTITVDYVNGGTGDVLDRIHYVRYDDNAVWWNKLWQVNSEVSGPMNFNVTVGGSYNVFIELRCFGAIPDFNYPVSGGWQFVPNLAFNITMVDAGISYYTKEYINGTLLDRITYTYETQMNEQIVLMQNDIAVMFGNQITPVGKGYDNIVKYSNMYAEDLKMSPSNITHSYLILDDGYITYNVQYVNPWQWSYDINYNDYSIISNQDYFIVADPNVFTVDNDYQMKYPKEVGEGEHILNIFSGSTFFTPDMFNINVTYYKSYDGENVSIHTFRYSDGPIYSYTALDPYDPTLFYYKIQIYDVNGLVYQQLYYADSPKDSVIDIDLGTSYQYPNFPKVSYVSIYSIDGLGLESSMFKVYANNTRVQLPFITFATKDVNIKILDFFGSQLYLNVTEFDYEIDIYIPVFNMFIANNYSESIRIQISRTSGSGIKFVQVIPAQSAISYRFLANIEYSIKAYALNGTLLNSASVDLNKNDMLVTFGFYSTLLPSLPPIIETRISDYLQMSILGLVSMVIVVIFVIRGQNTAATVLKGSIKTKGLFGRW